MGSWAWDSKRKDLCLISTFVMKYEVKLSAESEGKGGAGSVRPGRHGMASVGSGKESTREKNRSAGAWSPHLRFEILGLKYDHCVGWHGFLLQYSVAGSLLTLFYLRIFL